QIGLSVLASGYSLVAMSSSPGPQVTFACGPLHHRWWSIGGFLALRHRVDLFGDRIQLSVRRLFLSQALLEKGSSIVHIELVGPGNQSAVARYLIVLDRLGAGDETDIHDAVFLRIFHHMLALPGKTLQR